MTKIDKEKTLEDLRSQLEQFMHECGWTSTPYDDGYVRGMKDAIRMVELREEE